nr:hypothetical protein [uncultured Bacteroides sp.]
MIRKFGKTVLPLNCDKDKINELIDLIIFSFGDSFSFKSLCQDFKGKAEQENLFKKEANTEYSNIELNSEAIISINKIIWDKIWNKELIIDLYADTYHQYPNDFVLIKMKD